MGDHLVRGRDHLRRRGKRQIFFYTIPKNLGISTHGAERGIVRDFPDYKTSGISGVIRLFLLTMMHALIHYTI